jgi:hypothetical protein
MAGLPVPVPDEAWGCGVEKVTVAEAQKVEQIQATNQTSKHNASPSVG